MFFRKAMTFFRGPAYGGLEQEIADISDARRMKQKELESVASDKSSSILQVNLVVGSLQMYRVSHQGRK